MQPGLGFADGQDHHGFHIFRPTLGGGIEIAHGIQLVAEKFTAERLVGGRGVDVQNAAADSKLTGAFYHGTATVTGMSQAGEDFLNGIFLAHFQGKNSMLQHIHRHGPLAQRLPGKDLQRCPTLCQLMQLTQTLLLPGTGDHSAVIERQFTAGQYRYFLTQKGFQLRLQTLGGHVVLADGHQGSVAVTAQTGQNMAAVDLTDAADGSSLSVL